MRKNDTQSAFSHLKFWSEEIQTKITENCTILHKKVRISTERQAGVEKSI